MKSMTSLSISGLLLSGLMLGLYGQSPERSQALGIRVGSDGVFIRVLITDPLNRFVAGLDQKNFRIYENGREQNIRYFSRQDAPVSMGIIFDLTGIMGISASRAFEAIKRFQKEGLPGDEYFLLSFDRKTATLKNYSRPEETPVPVTLDPKGGETALRQAIVPALERIKKAGNEKRALVIIADREIASSLPTVQVYTISGVTWNMRSQPSAEVKGVRPFIVSQPSELDYYLNLVHDELRNQYVLGYASTNNKPDGKWRKIEVKLNPPKGLPKLSVNASQGYFASQGDNPIQK